MVDHHVYDTREPFALTHLHNHPVTILFHDNVSAHWTHLIPIHATISEHINALSKRFSKYKSDFQCWERKWKKQYAACQQEITRTDNIPNRVAWTLKGGFDHCNNINMSENMGDTTMAQLRMDTISHHSLAPKRKSSPMQEPQDH